jgi:uncharacterized membrane protein
LRDVVNIFKPSLDVKHFKVDGYANAWYIDGQKPQQLVVEYLPQRYFILGIIVTIVITVGIILTIFFLLYQEKKNKIR